VKYDLDGTAAERAPFDGHALTDIRLTAGEVAIFRVDP
jgi:hypothetical protein